MKSKKISKLLGITSGAVTFMLVMGTISMPVFASDTTKQNEYKVNSVLLDKQNSNNVIEQNGSKLTVADITGSKNKINLKIKFESDTEFDDVDEMSMVCNVYMEGTNKESWGYSTNLTDKHTMEIDSEVENEEGFPTTGVVRVDFVFGHKDFNGTLRIPVDFTNNFSEDISKDLNVKVNDTDENIDKFISNAIETKVVTSKILPEDENFFGGGFGMNDNTMFVLKSDDKMYGTDGWSERSGEDNKSIQGYQFDDVKYNDLKDAKNISIIPISRNQSLEDTENYKDDKYDSITEDNVTYENAFKFADNTESAIKLEKTNETIKFYCKSDSYNKSLLIANAIGGIFIKDNDEETRSESGKKVMYNDVNDKNTVVVEFKNEYPDREFNMHINYHVTSIDKYKIGEEIKVK